MSLTGSARRRQGDDLAREDEVRVAASAACARFAAMTARQYARDRRRRRVVRCRARRARRARCARGCRRRARRASGRPERGRGAEDGAGVGAGCGARRSGGGADDRLVVDRGAPGPATGAAAAGSVVAITARADDREPRRARPTKRGREPRATRARVGRARCRRRSRTCADTTGARRCTRRRRPTPPRAATRRRVQRRDGTRHCGRAAPQERERRRGESGDADEREVAESGAGSSCVGRRYEDV